MFSFIAPRYDLTNDVLSFGLHRQWRRDAVRASAVQSGQSVLDCATGTGDLALAFKRAVGPQGAVVGTDFCPEMLAVAPLKAKKAGLDLRFQIADATALPFADDCFDVASMGFGIRNVDDPVRALVEMARVVRPGGKVVILEFGQPHGWFGGMFRLYSRAILPRVGAVLTGHRTAYQYLPQTAACFPSGSRFLSLMDEAQAFEQRWERSLTLGTAYIYVGIVR